MVDRMLTLPPEHGHCHEVSRTHTHTQSGRHTNVRIAKTERKRVVDWLLLGLNPVCVCVLRLRNPFANPIQHTEGAVQARQIETK